MTAERRLEARALWAALTSQDLRADSARLRADARLLRLQATMPGANALTLAVTAWVLQSRGLG